MKLYHILILLILTIAAVGCTEQHLIGGDKDSHGCLIAAGYSWCDAKQKCIRVFEENCTSDESNGTTQIANPASVNCINKGGNLEIVADETGGQIGMCTLSDGTKCEEWAFMRGECFRGIYSCTSESDCVPKPGCHPHECINSAYSGNFAMPDACTMLFDCSAAYSKADCLCVNHTCTNKNLGSKGCSEVATE